MKPKTKLLNTLKSYKGNVRESDICDIKNACIDYINETQQSGDLEDLLYKIVDYERVMECIKRKAEKYDLRGVQRIAEDLPKCDYYLDNGDDEFEELGQEDLEDRLNDLINEVKSFNN